ncbi:hypothetical protein LP420_35980 [Massilia sp. B-10]|nr:hypothetical protein LP420_35980 [Massilia sp. B-10]
MKRLIKLLLAAAVLAPGAVFLVQTLHEPGSEQRAVAVADQAAQRERGAYLARA